MRELCALPLQRDHTIQHKQISPRLSDQPAVKVKKKGTHGNALPIRHRGATQGGQIRAIPLRRNELGSECLGINRETVLRVGDFASLLLLVSLLTHSSDKIYKRAKANGIPLNHPRTGHPPIFDNAKNQRLVNSTRDTRTRPLTWEALCTEMG